MLSKTSTTPGGQMLEVHTQCDSLILRICIKFSDDDGYIVQFFWSSIMCYIYA